MQNVGAWVMIGGLSLLPVFFLPVTQDAFDTNKWMLLVGAALVILLLWGVRTLTTGTLTIAWNGTVKRLGLLALATLASILVSPNKVEALLTPLGAGTFLALFVVASVGATFLDHKTRAILSWALMTTGSLVALLAIYRFVGLGGDPLWTPVGTNVGLMIVLVVTIPILIGHARRHSVAIVMGVACLGGLVLTTYQVLLTWNTTVLPYWVNWQILLESYKNWKSLLVGVGAENFLAAFTAGRPAALNMTAIWNTRFTLGSSLAFHIATVYGLVGAAAFGWFLTKIHPVAIFALLLLPPSFSALVVVVAILIVSEPAHPMSLKGSHPSRLIAIVVFLLVGWAGYGLMRAYGAELAFASSIKALESRDGTGAYHLQIQAISRNPHVTRFHTAYSQTNVALASALAGTATSSASPETRDQNRQTTTQLIQQAIREAKIAVNLAPRNLLAWEHIATVYQTLTGVAQGADQWTVAAYSQAVQLDPTNPVIRLRLGGAYVGQQKLDLAAESYAAAIALKPDYANAYYNLAFVYRQQKKFLPAAQALEQALQYVIPGGDDARRAQKEREELRELLTEEEKQMLDTNETTTSSEILSPLP